MSFQFSPIFFSFSKICEMLINFGANWLFLWGFFVMSSLAENTNQFIRFTSNYGLGLYWPYPFFSFASLAIWDLEKVRYFLYWKFQDWNNNPKILTFHVLLLIPIENIPGFRQRFCYRRYTLVVGIFTSSNFSCFLSISYLEMQKMKKNVVLKYFGNLQNIARGYLNNLNIFWNSEF